MKKNTTVFFCQNCGYEAAKWSGQCPACREWNTFAEEPVAPKQKGVSTRKTGNRERKSPISLKNITSADQERISTDIGELDQVLDRKSTRLNSSHEA